MSRPHEPGPSPARDAVRQRTGARRNDDDEDGGRRNDDEGALLDGDEERAGDHDEAFISIYPMRGFRVPPSRSIRQLCRYVLGDVSHFPAS